MTTPTACSSANAHSADTPLSTHQKLMIGSAKCQGLDKTDAMHCLGRLSLGIFFDGTGNNEQADFREQKFSNVARLYHAYPDNQTNNYTDKIYKYYIPGVGTPFKEIGDSGKGVDKIMGMAAAAMAEQRIIWGLIQVINGVHRFARNVKLIDDEQAKVMAGNIGGAGSSGWQRHTALKDYYQTKLKNNIVNYRPKLKDITIDVFGFSRGAAQARAWANWLFELCEKKGDDYYFAGVPLRIRFMGLFDTVASVGLAGLEVGTPADQNGHYAWANENLQIHPAIGLCIHFMASLEVRSCFPGDSTREGAHYPNNVRETMYPGSHSDVGGGYSPRAQGKTDELARVAGFNMYKEALLVAVPFYSLEILKEKDKPTYRELIPKNETVTLFNTYMKAINVSGSVEQQHRQHMDAYFLYRFLCGENYGNRPFLKNATFKERQSLLKTQSDFLKYLKDIQMSAIYDRQDHDRVFEKFTDEKYTSQAMVEKYQQLTTADTSRYLANWRQWMKDHRCAELLHELPELCITDIVMKFSNHPKEMDKHCIQFFDEFVHDSMAGFINDGVDEFKQNSYGLLKYRRLFFGNHEDQYARAHVKIENNRRKQEFKQQRSQRKQWDMEAEEFRRTRS